MAISSSRSSGSFETEQDFYIPMPSVDEQSPASTHELQPWGADEHVTIKPSWRSLFVFTSRSDAPSLAVALISSLLSALGRPTAAIFFGKVFDSLTEFAAGNSRAQDTLHSVASSCLVLVGVGGASWVIEATFLASWMHFGELQAKCVRHKMFEGMLNKEMEWYDSQQNGIGSLLIRMETQIRELQLAVSQPLGFLVFEIFGSLASLGLAFYYSWSLTLVIIAVFPIAALILFFVSRPLTPAVEAQKQELSQASKYANAAIAAIDTVKAYNGQEQEVWQYHSTIKRVAAKYMIQARCNALQFGITKFLMKGIFVQGFWFGLYLVDKGMDPGHVLTTFWACLAAMQAVEVVLPEWLVLVKGMSAGETLKSIMVQVEHGREVGHIVGTTKPKASPGDIEINEVSFAYPSNLQQNVLNNVTFFFPEGETTYIVGKSGSGKSTLGNLLTKDYEPLQGEILIDGHSIHTLDAEWLRQNVMLVQQQAVLFNETMYQNIAFGGRGDVTKGNVLEASQIGDLRQTILDLPDGIDTLVGSNGMTLSGGQQQRVAIARARLRDAPIVILDEATGALDQKSRQRVMEEIRKWRKKKTTIIITHDVSQILDDEYVYVLDHGAVVQEGYCKKLAEKGRGMFAYFLPLSKTGESTTPEPRRQSEPASSTTPDQDDESSNSRWKAIAEIFDMHQAANSSSETTAAEERLPSHYDVGNIGRKGLFEEPVWTVPQQPFQTPLLGSTRRGSMAFHSPRPQSIIGFQDLRRPSQGETPKLAMGAFSAVPEYTQPRPTPPLPINTAKVPQSSPKPIRQDSNLPRSQTLKSKIPETITPASFEKILETIWPVLSGNERVYFVLGFLFAFIVAVATPVFAYVFARLLNVHNLPGDRVAQGKLFAFTLLGVAIVDAVSTFCMHYALEYSGQAWIDALRVEALKRILEQPRCWFDKERNSTARLNERLDRNAEEMRNIVGRFSAPIFITIWMLSISIVWAFIISWKLTLVALACTPVAYATSRLFSYVTSKWEEKCSVLAAQASNTFTETFSNIRVVRALTLESHFKRKHNLSTAQTYKTGKSRALYSGLTYGMVDGISFFVTATIFYYGAVLVTDGSISVASDLEVVNLLLFGISNSIWTLSLIPQLSQSRTTATHMIKLTRLPLKSHENLGTRRLASPFPVIFSKLNFTYPSRPKHRTLSDINLTLTPGSCTALVGPSGSGKSTIASLILALYRPDEVQPHQVPPLTFSGTPVEQCNVSSLRSHLAILPQTPILFPTTIFQNIIYGLPEGSPSSSLRATILAAQDAGIHDFIQSLPNGYNTIVGEGGQGLSGGQAQRIAIARAIVRRPKVLILDEATSALDAVSAEMVRETVAKLIERGRQSGEEGTAVLVISHGIEMMRICDTVVVIENGCVVEKGGFEELRRRGGALSRLLGEKGSPSGRKSRELIPPVERRKSDTWMSKTSVD